MSYYQTKSSNNETKAEAWDRLSELYCDADFENYCGRNNFINGNVSEGDLHEWAQMRTVDY